MVTIRQASEHDLDRLQTIQRAALSEPWPELLETAVEGVLPVLVADDGGPVGYVIVVPGTDRAAYVPELAVDPRAQREGHGSALLVAVYERLREEGYSAVRLTVREIDEGAQSFYSAQGFERVERVADQFESGDGFVLERELEE